MSGTGATLAEYAQFLERRGRLVMVGDSPWYFDGEKLVPVTPPHRMTPVPLELLNRAVRQAGAWVALWNESWNTSAVPWWWICCDDKNYDFPSIRSSRRSSARRGLRQCQVHLLDGQWFARNGYDVYAAAHGRYGWHMKPCSREAFEEEALGNGQYGGRETWGAFIGDALAAYASCVVVDDMVILSSAKSDPALLKSNPNEALFFTLTSHYLRERRMSYVTDGCRALEHETRIQDFLESLGYRRIYCPLKLAVRPWLELAAKCGAGKWARLLGAGWWSPRLLSRASALAMACEIAGSCARWEGGRRIDRAGSDEPRPPSMGHGPAEPESEFEEKL